MGSPIPLLVRECSYNYFKRTPSRGEGLSSLRGQYRRNAGPRYRKAFGHNSYRAVLGESHSMGNRGQFGDLDKVFDEATIRQAVAATARYIEAHAGGKPITLVPIMDAAIFFGVDIMRAYGGDCYFAPVKVSRYLPAWARVEEDEFNHTFVASYSMFKPDTQIVLVDTIIDTGKSIELALSVLPRKPIAVVALVVKTDKAAQSYTFRRHELDIHASFFLKGDPWLVGYGCDDDGLMRGLPWIGVKYEEDGLDKN